MSRFAHNHIVPKIVLVCLACTLAFGPALVNAAAITGTQRDTAKASAILNAPTKTVPNSDYNATYVIQNGVQDPTTHSATALGDKQAEAAHQNALPNSENKQVQVNSSQQNNKGINPETSWGAWLGNLILSTASYITYLGGILLEVAIDQLVLQMGGWISGSSGIGVAINTSWSVIRDICNLVFIFGFLWIGIRAILDFDSSSTKRFFATLVIAAILINFSLFFAKLVIDVANVFAVDIYNSVSGNANIAAAFMQALGLNTIYQTGTDQLAKMTNAGEIWFFIGAALFLLIAGFVFAAGAVLIVIRFVVLIFLMIGSPILFAAMVFPQTQKYAKQLWQMLISYAFFAPAYLLLLLISLQITQGAASVLFSSGNSFYQDLTKLPTDQQIGVGNVILNFTVIIFFLILSLKIANEFSIKGASQVIATGKAIRGHAQRFAGAATAGLAARGLRSTVGFGAQYAADKQGFKDYASRSKIGAALLRGTRGVADSSFEARRLGGIGKTLGVGEGKKGGYTTRKKEHAEAEKKFAESLGQDKALVARTEAEQDLLINQAKANLDTEKETVRNETRQQRTDLTEAARMRRDAESRGDKQGVKEATDKINALKAEIDTIEDRHKGEIDRLQAVVTAAQGTKTVMVDRAKGRRQTAYAETVVRPVVFAGDRRTSIGGYEGPNSAKYRASEYRMGSYKNSAAAEAILEAVNKSKGDKDQEKLLDAISKISKSD